MDTLKAYDVEDSVATEPQITEVEMTESQYEVHSQTADINSLSTDTQEQDTHTVTLEGQTLESQYTASLSTEPQHSLSATAESQVDSQSTSEQYTESQTPTTLTGESQASITASQAIDSQAIDSQITDSQITDSQTTDSQITDSQTTEIQAEAAPEVPVNIELGKYWTSVRENPGDFTGWTYLLQYVEQECSLFEARPAFEEFLTRYPYCYGYWKKYADLERKHNNLDACEQVFEKGLKAIPLSIDLWIHYITFTQEKYEADLDKEIRIRTLYERALMAAGTDFRSDKLWDLYLFWEQENKSLKNITSIYDRVLSIPTQLYAQHFENFSKHVNQHNPREILSLDEFLKLRQQVIKKKAPKEETTDDVDEAVAHTTDDAAPPGMELPLGAGPSGADIPPGMDDKGLEDESEIAAIKEVIIEQRQTVHKLNEQEVSRRWTFEEGVRRPYFHVKPLEKVQLKNWREYLEFEMEFGTHERTVILFERCLIACALYEEFWLKYAKYLEQHNSEAVRHTYQRACTIYLRKKPNIHLAWSSFEERLGNLEIASSILTDFEKEVPNLAMVCLRQISLVRRQGHFDKVETLYKKYMADAENDKSRSFYAIKYARYQAKILRNVTTAREILHAALEKDQANAKLYLQLMDLEFQQADVDEAKLTDIFDKAMIGSLPMEHKITFSQRRMEFMEDFSSSVAKVQQAYEDHQKLMKENAQGGKKRKGTALDDASEEKKLKADNGVVSNGTDASQNSSQSYSQPTAHTQPAADYTAQNQWNQYGQQWNTGYNMPYNYNPWGPYSNNYYG